MKVWIICQEPFPLGFAATKRIQCYAKALIAGGLECEVLVFNRNEKGCRRKNKAVSGVYEGIPFRYMGLTTRKPGLKYARILMERLDFRVLKRLLKNELKAGDAVLGFNVSDADQALQIIETVHRKGSKFVRELCEIPYFGSQSEKAKRGLQRNLDEVFPRLDGVIAISDTLVALAEKHVSPGTKIIKVPILVDFKQYDLADESESETIPFIFHSGTLYEQKDGVLGMIEAFAKAKEKYGRPLRYVFAGDLDSTPQKEEILSLIKKYGLEQDIIFTGYLKPSDGIVYLAKAALVILNKHANPQNLYGFSTKLGEYLAAGKCVLTTDVGEAMNWLEDGVNARIVPKDDIAALADGIVGILEDRDTSHRLGENGRELCRNNFDWRKVSDKMCMFVQSL